MIKMPATRGTGGTPLKVIPAPKIMRKRPNPDKAPYLPNKDFLLIITLMRAPNTGRRRETKKEAAKSPQEPI